MGISQDGLVSSAYARSLIRIKTRQLCRRTDFSISDMEDLHQEMRQYLLKVAHRFNPDRASLETFIARALDSCVAMILRHRRRKKRQIDLECISLERTEFPTETGPACLWSILAPDDQSRRSGNMPEDPIETFDRREAVAHVLSQLTDEDRTIALLVIEHGKAGAARRHGVSRYQIKCALDRMRAYCEDAGIFPDRRAHLGRKRHT